MHVRFAITVVNRQTETHFAFAMENVKQQNRAQILGGKFRLQLPFEVRTFSRRVAVGMTRGLCAGLPQHADFPAFSGELGRSSAPRGPPLLDRDAQRNLRFKKSDPCCGPVKVPSCLMLATRIPSSQSQGRPARTPRIASS